MILGMPTSLTQITFVYPILPNTMPRSIKYIQSIMSGVSYKRAFIYLSDLINLNQFIIIRTTLDGTFIGGTHYMRFSSSTST